MPVAACPKCSARVKVAPDLADDARVRCDQCGKRFAIADADSPAENPRKLDKPEATPSNHRVLLIVLVAFGGLALLLAGIAVAWVATRSPKRVAPPVAIAPAPDPQPESTPPPAPQRQKPLGEGDDLIASALLALYGADPAGAAARYDGATIVVTGKLAKPTERAANGEIVIELSGVSSSDLRVWCRMNPNRDKAAENLSAGTVVAIRGRCTGSGALGARSREINSQSIPTGDVILIDCVFVGEPVPPMPQTLPMSPTQPMPTLPTPNGVDYPQGIEHNGIEVRVTGAYVGKPIMILGNVGPSAGARAPTAKTYLVLKIRVRNTREIGFMASYIYDTPEASQLKLTDEKGNSFAWCYQSATAEPDSVVARELAANPKRVWWFLGDSTKHIVDPGQAQSYLLVFSADHLGKGTRLFLWLPDRVFGELKFDQVIRLDQAEVKSLPTGLEKPPQPDPVFEAKVAELTRQLAKGKNTADRIKAAEELLKLGTKAKASTGVLCQALFDPSPQVRLAALDALKSVNPAVYAPVATLVAPLTEADFLFMGSSGRPQAVAALAKLGAEGRAAVPILIWYKQEISKPGGWPQVPAVMAALAVLAPDDPTVVAVLVQSLSKDGLAEVRVVAAKGLARTKATKESVAALAVAARSDPEADVRLAAVTTLGAMGSDAKLALKVVEAAKTDPDMRVREAARNASSKIK